MMGSRSFLIFLFILMEIVLYGKSKNILFCLAYLAYNMDKFYAYQINTEERKKYNNKSMKRKLKFIN